MDFSESELNVRIWLILVENKILGRIIHWATAINSKSENCRNCGPNVFTISQSINQSKPLFKHDED